VPKGPGGTPGSEKSIEFVVNVTVGFDPQSDRNCPNVAFEVFGEPGKLLRHASPLINPEAQELVDRAKKATVTQAARRTTIFISYAACSWLFCDSDRFKSAANLFTSSTILLFASVVINVLLYSSQRGGGIFISATAE
jgi:hypothetical protein